MSTVTFFFLLFGKLISEILATKKKIDQKNKKSNKFSMQTGDEEV